VEPRFVWNYSCQLEIIDLVTGRKHSRHDWTLVDVDSFVSHLNRSHQANLKPLPIGSNNTWRV
jgi:hypothetical protein